LIYHSLFYPQFLSSFPLGKCTLYLAIQAAYGEHNEPGKNPCEREYKASTFVGLQRSLAQESKNIWKISKKNFPCFGAGNYPPHVYESNSTWKGKIKFRGS